MFMPKKKAIIDNEEEKPRLTASEKQQDNLNIFLIVLDVFSRYAWVREIPDKKVDTVAREFKDIFKSSNRKPDKLWTDEGAEFEFLIDKGEPEEKTAFKCPYCGQYLKNKSGLTQHINRTHPDPTNIQEEEANKNKKNRLKDIVLYHTQGKNKASIAERFIKTLKDMIGRWMTDNEGKNYLSHLQSLVEEYNNTPHRKFNDTYTPKEASLKKNEEKIYTKYYKDSFPDFGSLDFVTQKEIIIEDDKVRIPRRKKEGWEKAFTPNWSKEIFKIREVKNTIPVTYYLKDYKDHHIKGAFYRQELQKTNYPFQEWMGHSKPRTKENARLGMESVKKEAERQKAKKQRQRDRKKEQPGLGLKLPSALVSKLPPNKTLSNYDLQEVCKDVKGWRGVYSRDNLPKKPNIRECGILNLDDKKGPGTHWVCWFKNKKNKYYFDSYGLQPPLEIIKYLKSPIHYSSYQIQDPNTVICGHLCVFVLDKLNKGHDLYPVISYLMDLKEKKI